MIIVIPSGKIAINLFLRGKTSVLDKKHHTRDNQDTFESGELK